MTRLRPAALLLLAALPGAAWAACNPVGTEDCCTKVETPECEEVDWPEADGIEISGTCTSVAFELVGLTSGRYVKKTTVDWIANDPSVECPTNQIRLEEFTFEATVTWRITENGTVVKTGSGSFAESPDPVSGSIGCTFTLSSDAGICGENSEDYSASTNLPVASVSIPSIVGSNDLVEPCEDEVDPVTSVEELHDDEDDLYQVHWSCSPDPEEVTIWSTTPQKLQIHVDKEGTLAHVYHYPEMSRTEPIWAEGLLRSDVPDDAVVKMLYKVNGVTCETSNACTVVSVDLDKDAYNRMDPFPQVEITQVENLVTGQTATVHYRVLPDLATPEGAVLQATFQVSTEPGTHEWRTPPFRNRFGNEGWDALRYTVYVAGNREKRIRKGESTPSHRALVEPPPECLATVQTGDALAFEADAIFGHLASTPPIQTPRKATGAYPDWKVENIKLFKRAADHYYTNEMVLAELGTTAVREILLGETQDTAVGLELTCDPVVCVNDFYEDGDPGDSAVTNQVWTDPDFIGPVELDGIPGCIATGSYQWQITGDANLVIREDDGSLFVGKFYEGRYEDGIKYPKIEGRESSTVKDDVEIRFLLQVDPSEENPKAFRGAELPASAKLTVADTRWTVSKPDGEAGRSAERTDLLSCDLDLRPCIALASFNPVYATNLVVSGVVTSMCDIVRDIRVNGAQVPMTNILFRGESVEDFDGVTIKENTWGLDPPYVVTFDYTIPDFRTNVVFVEAFGTRTAVPGRHRTAVSFPTDAEAGTNGLCGVPQADPVSKNLPFEEFYRQDWDFLYKFEVDHAGSGDGILECEPDLNCGSQGLDREYHRLELPMLFFPPDTPPAISRIGKGFLTNLVDMASVTGRYETATGRDSISKLFPCQLTVYGMDNRPVPDCDEWWLGAFAALGTEVRLEPACPELPAGRSETAKITLKKTRDAPFDGGPNGVFPNFTEIVWTGRTGVETQTLHPATSGVAEFELSVNSDFCTSKDRVRVTVIGIDLDIDSDNNDEFDGPSRTDEEDACEDPAQGSGEFGRILIVDDDNKDSDSVPDFADGYGFFAVNAPEDLDDRDKKICDSLENPQAQFVPMVFDLSGVTNVDDFVVTLDYPRSDPFALCLNESNWYVRPETGNLRLWRKEGKELRSGKSIADGGDYVAPGEYPARQFGFSEFVHVVTNYVEAVRHSNQPGDIRIVFGVRPAKGSYSQSVTNDAVVVTALQFGLIPDWNRDGAIDDDDRKRLERKGVFRFWINDDHDGDIQSHISIEHNMNHTPTTVYKPVIIPSYGFNVDAQFDSPEGSYSETLPEEVPKTPNCLDGKVNTIRDAIDFFPVSLVVPTNLVSKQECGLSLLQPESAINFGYTSLSNAGVRALFTECPTNFGSGLDKKLESAPVTVLTASSIALSREWLAARIESPVLMFESRAKTEKPVSLQVRWKGKDIGSWAMGFSSSPVKDMMRHLNIRDKDSIFTIHGCSIGCWRTEMDVPSNYPDGFYYDEGATERTLVAIHGLDWDEQEAPAGNAEIFKRCFQAGINARFVATSWGSEIARVHAWPIGEIGPLNYGFSVIGAFVAANLFHTSLTNALSESKTTLLAHSLGNVVASSMLHDYSFPAERYLMLNPAVPIEAYEGTQTNGAQYCAMTHPLWKQSGWYAFSRQCAGWSTLFSDDDNRKFVTWDQRFAGITNGGIQVRQYFSSEEDVLRKNDSPGGIPPLGSWAISGNSGSTNVLNHEWVWVFNEITKGQMDLDLRTVCANHDFAGWGFNKKYGTYTHDFPGSTWHPMPPDDANGIPVNDLIQRPFFARFDEGNDPNAPEWGDDVPWWHFAHVHSEWIYSEDRSSDVNSRLPTTPFLATASTNQIKNHAKLLAECMPALSFAAGGTKMTNCIPDHMSLDLQGYVNDNWAPRPKKPGFQTKRWLHGDYIDAPPFLTFKLYVDIANTMKEIKQKAPQ